VVVRIGGAAELSPSPGGHPVPAHRGAQRVAAAGRARRPELGVNARAAVAGLRLGVDLLDGDDQGLAPPLARAGRPSPPAVVAAGRDAEHLAHQPDRPAVAVALHESVPHDDSLAKKAVAFFKISRSMRSRWFSARSRRSSSSTAGRCPLPGNACAPSSARACFQLRSMLSLRSRSRATSARLRPCSVMRRTASILNSRVNVRRCLAIADLLTSSLRSFLSAHHSWGSPPSRARGCRSGGCAVKAVELTSGGLRRVSVTGLRGPRGSLTPVQKSAEGIVGRAVGEAIY